MKVFFARVVGSWLLFTICALGFLGALGPALISAPSTSAVALGIVLLMILLAWLAHLVSRHLHHRH